MEVGDGASPSGAHCNEVARQRVRGLATKNMDLLTLSKNSWLYGCIRTQSLQLTIGYTGKIPSFSAAICDSCVHCRTIQDPVGMRGPILGAEIKPSQRMSRALSFLHTSKMQHCAEENIQQEPCSATDSS